MWNTKRVGRSKVKLLIVVGALVLLATAGGLAAKTLSANKETPAQQKQRVMNLDGKIYKAMDPAAKYDFKAAKVNLDRLAQQYPDVYDHQSFLTTMFTVCAEVQDEACKRNTARQIVGLKAAGKSYPKNISKEQIAEIQKYAQ